MYIYIYLYTCICTYIYTYIYINIYSMVEHVAVCWIALHDLVVCRMVL